MGLWNWLFGAKGKEKEKATELQWKGQEVVVNPSDAQRASRNQARIEAIQWVLVNSRKLTPEKREALEKELKKRLLLKKLQED